MTAPDKSADPSAGPAGKSDVATHSRRQRREVTTEELFGGGSEIRILHAEQVYTLRQTARGKLILTK